MARSQKRKGSLVKLSAEQIDKFVLPHRTIGSRGAAPKLSLYKSFN